MSIIRTLKYYFIRLIRKVSRIIDYLKQIELNQWLIIIPIIGLSFFFFFISNWKFPLESGTIGDTVGGILGTTVNLIAAILVYRSFQAQIAANQDINQQLKEDRFFKLLETIIQFKNQEYMTTMIATLKTQIEEVQKIAIEIDKESKATEKSVELHTKSIYQSFQSLMKKTESYSDSLVRFIQLVEEARKFITPSEKSLKMVLESNFTFEEARVLDVVSKLNEEIEMKAQKIKIINNVNVALIELIENSPIIFIEPMPNEVYASEINALKIKFKNMSKKRLEVSKCKLFEDEISTFQRKEISDALSCSLTDLGIDIGIGIGEKELAFEIDYNGKKYTYDVEFKVIENTSSIISSQT